MFFAVINWVAIGLVIWRVDPETIRDFIIPGSYLPMTLLVMGGIFWLLSILLMSASAALRWTIGMTAFLELRVLGLGSVLNGILILGLLISWEVYTYKSRTQGIKEPASRQGGSRTQEVTIRD